MSTTMECLSSNGEFDCDCDSEAYRSRLELWGVIGVSSTSSGRILVGVAWLPAPVRGGEMGSAVLTAREKVGVEVELLLGVAGGERADERSGRGGVDGAARRLRAGG